MEGKCALLPLLSLSCRTLLLCLKEEQPQDTWKLVRLAEAQGLPQTIDIRICIFMSSPGDSYAYYCLRSNPVEDNVDPPKVSTGEG